MKDSVAATRARKAALDARLGRQDAAQEISYIDPANYAEITKSVSDAFIDQCIARREVGYAALLAELFRWRFVKNLDARRDDVLQLTPDMTYTLNKSRPLVAHVDAVQLCLRRRETAKREEAARLRRGEQKELAKAMDQEADEIAKSIAKLDSIPTRLRVCDFAFHGERGLGVDGSAFDYCPGAVPCRNGLLEFYEGVPVLRPFRPSDLITKTLAAPFRPEWLDLPLEEVCPGWQAFGLEVCEGPERWAYVQRVMGYALLGLPVQEKFFVYYGLGRNGKGALIETIQALFGDLAAVLPVEALLERRNPLNPGGPRADMANLQGCRLAISSEPPPKQSWNISELKLHTGGNSISARGPHALRATEFRPSHVLVVESNHQLGVDAGDFAFWSRLSLIPFNLRFVENPSPNRPYERRLDPGLKARLLEELEGVLVWCVRGAMDYLAGGLRPDAASVAASRQYRQDEDLHGDFLEALCIVDDRIHELPNPADEYLGLDGTHTCPSGELYERWQGWCEGQGIRNPGAHGTFAKHITKKGYPTRKLAGGYKHFLGLSMK